MKNNFNMKELLKTLGNNIWRSLSKNFAYKLFSVLIAVLLWSYVISANPSITRDKTLNVDLSVSGQTVLETRGFAVLGLDLTAETPSVSVRVSAPQSSINMVSEDNVRAELDLSSVRKVGKQQVKLRATSTFGTVLQVSPESIEVDIEYQEQRVVPITVSLTGESDDRWYDVSRPNPQTVILTGPSSQVLSASEAHVVVDLTGRTDSHRRVESINILDAQGDQITSGLTLSAKSVSLDVSIFPTKLLPVNVNIDELVTGDLPAGYVLEDIQVQPSYIQVAADQVLLDSLTSVALEPIDIEGATHSLTKNTPIQKLDAAKNYSSVSVNVSLTISEETLENVIPNVTPDLIGLRDELRIKKNSIKLNVTVVGPYSIVQPLKREDLVATVDLSDISEAGTYQLPISVSVPNNPELGFTTVPAVANITILDK